ncbi:MAG TPA: sterol desaturase family protein [Chitinophagales bacterium]|nr:sterol desaturase family protein [Chitinophagales bacterium]
MPLYSFLYVHFSIFKIPLNPYTFILGFVIFDFVYYVMHRLSHNNEILWIGHSVHHQSTVFDFSGACRQGLFAPLLTFPFYMTLALIGFDVKTFLLVASVNAGLQFLEHTELFNNLGILDKVFMAPKNHRIHHSTNIADSNKNYGGVFLIWDICFRTSADPNVKVNAYGLDKPFVTNSVLYANVFPVMEFVTNIFSKFFPLNKNLSVEPLKADPNKSNNQRANVRTSSYKWIQYYCLIQFIILFNFSVHFLLTVGNLDLSKIILSILIISLGNFSMGYIISNKKYAVLIDIVRLCISIPIAINFI